MSTNIYKLLHKYDAVLLFNFVINMKETRWGGDIIEA